MGETKERKHKEKIEQLGIPARLYSHIPQPGRLKTLQDANQNKLGYPTCK